jgi:hypothetical protein
MSYFLALAVFAESSRFFVGLVFGDEGVAHVCDRPMDATIEQQGNGMTYHGRIEI